MLTTRLIFACGMALVFVLALPATDDSDLETITMDGTGKNNATAQTWANRKAVERIVWQFADSETREKNKTALQQKFYDKPDIFVAKSEIVSSKTMGNKVTVLAKVTINKSKVEAQLAALNIIARGKQNKEAMPSKTTVSKATIPMENTNSSETGSNNAMEESVIVEGLGKTEASAKKAAYKEAVAKVVGVLI